MPSYEQWQQLDEAIEDYEELHAESEVMPRDPRLTQRLLKLAQVVVLCAKNVLLQHDAELELE